MAGFFKRLFGGTSDDQKQKEIKAKEEQASSSELKQEAPVSEPKSATPASEEKTDVQAQAKTAAQGKEEKSFLAQVEEKAEGIAEELTANADNLAEKTKEVAENVTNKAAEAFQEGKEFVKETSTQVLDSAEKIKEEGVEVLADVKEFLTEKVAEEKTAEVKNEELKIEEVKTKDSKVSVETNAQVQTTEEASADEPVKDESAKVESAEPKKKKGFFSRLVSGLSKTKDNLGAGIVTLFRGKKISKELFTELEDRLLMADVGLDTTDKIIGRLTEHVKITELNDAEALYSQLKEELREIIEPCAQPLEIKDHKPYLILMLGVNGVGKTTTIGKITKKLQMEGKSVVLAAADTFRAAAIEQLQEWGHRNNVPVIAQKPGSDSAAVIYDALSSAKAKGIDVVLADTAGRLQNKEHLLEELKKIVRVVQKIDPSAPHEVMITLDASTGQNAISQVEAFDKAVPITGINLTKLDGTAKGGVIFAICDKFKKPIRFIGIGEKIDDLQPFKADEFINALFKDK